MSFFSLIHIHPDVMTQKATRDEWHRLNAMGAAYRDHCLIWKLFSDGPWETRLADLEGQGSRELDFVFRRRDEAPRDPNTGTRARLSWYLVSQQRPKPVPGLLFLQGEPKAYDPLLQPGEAIRFQLRANPSVARKRPGLSPTTGKPMRSAHDDVLMQTKFLAKGPDRKQNMRTREDLRMQADQMNAAATAWLAARAERWGLRIDPEQLFADGYTQHRLRRNGEDICFSSLDYAGMAEVTDTSRLRAALLNGVGRKRAFGCGLLLVRRLG